MMNCYLLTQTVLLRNQKMFMKNCLGTKTIGKIQSFLMRLIKSYW